jgi:hypothetical protein
VAQRHIRATRVQPVSHQFHSTSLRDMKGRLPLYLALTGTVAVLSGFSITVALLVLRVNCDSGTSPMRVCLGYTNKIHWAYPIAAIGVTCFIAAGVSGAWLGRRRAEEPLLSSGGENLSTD